MFLKFEFERLMDANKIDNLDILAAGKVRNERVCDEHPERPAVLICINMGYAHCEECRDTTELRTGCGYCPDTGNCEIQAYYNKLENG